MHLCSPTGSGAGEALGADWCEGCAVTPLSPGTSFHPHVLLTGSRFLSPVSLHRHSSVWSPLQDSCPQCHCTDTNTNTALPVPLCRISVPKHSSAWSPLQDFCPQCHCTNTNTNTDTALPGSPCHPSLPEVLITPPAVHPLMLMDGADALRPHLLQEFLSARQTGRRWGALQPDRR